MNLEVLLSYCQWLIKAICFAEGGSIITPELRIISHCFAILLFIGFFTGRLLSIILNGKPNKQTIQNLIFEPVFGAVNIFCLINTWI